MVFHESQKVGVIVMLTQIFEAGRDKCAQYFPVHLEASMILTEEEPDIEDVPVGVERSNIHRNDHDDEENNIHHRSGIPTNEKDHIYAGKTSDDNNFSANHANIQEGGCLNIGKVTLLESSFDYESQSEVRRFELTIGSESKIVWHFLFAGWAENDPIGLDYEALVELIRLSASKCAPDNPLVVHCSAGVGRTGTFIALDHLLGELESGHLLHAFDPETDPIFETVNRMREQRMMMVYNDAQMQIIYHVLREQAQRKLGTLPTTDENVYIE
ncbi:Protein-tyrosine phosphatase catalytic [Penicillium verhagenii]|uniref:Protein-tyrosine phosphatase catalytic n=1 Tax=Penicillium verhagenii TaxID=1562060 RepID=UPI0025457027|nr:Protein-tyrosine phosphatase catalytic [Penicillium verhagenii]KAJ5927879.1 Protein-tyrosine phosphatase catalytic [Penicillium verhagenii]